VVSDIVPTYTECPTDSLCQKYERSINEASERRDEGRVAKGAVERKPNEGKRQHKNRKSKLQKAAPKGWKEYKDSDIEKKRERQTADGNNEETTE
jgi:hypothetical protein